MNKEKVIQSAEMAARKVAQLQEMYEDLESDFDIFGVDIGSASLAPNIHVAPASLDAISDRETWAWEWVDNSIGEHMYFRATVKLWGVTFQAVLDNNMDDDEPHEAKEYGCPEEVLREWAPF